ncbi:MAG: glycoside hydrolase family 10 protein [Gemmatimonadota bacterium]
MNTPLRVATFLLVAVCLAGRALGAQIWSPGEAYAPPPAGADTVAPALGREFRAVWIATVANMDWPSRPGLPVEEQKKELRRLLDLARGMRLNAVIFQVRPAADALYASPIEPWSYFLTGRMGRAPQPAFDPLAFAVAEAHQRGLELHAWFNPYRARHPSDTTSRAAATHISRRSPAVVHRYGPYQWMDPGEASVRALTQRVILDVVNRYDIDGVHIDDYFYPYPERDRRGRVMSFPDNRSWNRYVQSGGKLSRADWRRRNVDLLISELYGAIKRRKPWVKFGISPFGIWRPGHPEVVTGFDAWESLYADARRWLREGWADYFSPQLYWRVSAPRQPYGALLAWWQSQNTRGRYVWPGNYTSRASAPRTQWPWTEVFEQISETRSQLAASSGNVHFSMSAFVHNSDSLVERLMAGPYAEPALVPAASWLSDRDPRPPLVASRAEQSGVELTITPEAGGSRQRPPGGSSASPRWWLVRALYPEAWRARLVPASDSIIRLAATREHMPPRYITVSAVDRVGNESPPAVIVERLVESQKPR